MPTPPPAVLLTRPLADAQRFAARLSDQFAAKGDGDDPHEQGAPPRIVIAPVLRIVPVPHDGVRLQQARAVLFTSSHAVAAAAPGRGRRAICVGARTAQAARDAGFDAIAGPGTAADLPALIAALATLPPPLLCRNTPALPDTPVPPAQMTGLIHPHGAHLAVPLPVPGMVVYDQIAQALTPAAITLLSDPGAVILPVFSARSARVLSDKLRHIPVAGPLHLIAISAGAAREFNAPTASRLIAQHPDGDAMARATALIVRREQS